MLSNAFKHNLNHFLRLYGENAVRSSLVRLWLKSNAISDSIAAKDVDIEALLSSPSHGIIIDTLTKSTSFFNLKDLEGAFEAIIDNHRKKKQGSVYTPNYIIEYLFNSCTSCFLTSLRNIKILDPACGSGGFLIKALDILSSKHDSCIEHFVSNSLYGVDNDPWAIRHASYLIKLYLMNKGICSSDYQLNLYVLDSLLTNSNDLLFKLGVPEGFDVIVTNPPYVKLQNIENKYRSSLLSKFPYYTKGSFSLSLLFLLIGHNLLSENGRLGYITQNNLFTSLAGEPIRNYIQNNRCLLKIINFCHNHVFPNASAYTCLIFLSKSNYNKFYYAEIRRKVNANSLNNCTFDKLDTCFLTPKKWRLAMNIDLLNLRKIENIGRPLGAITDIRVGFATLKDRVYFATEKNGDCTAIDTNGNIHKIEIEATKPALKLSKINNTSDIYSSETRIIFPYKKCNRGFHCINEADFLQIYPSTYTYLKAMRSLLDKRSKGKLKVFPWYLWGRTQSLEAPGPKLLTKTFSKRPNFILDPTDSLFCNGYSIKPRLSDLYSNKININLLKKILNSDIMLYYTKLTSFQIEGNYQCYQKNFIERFGMPILNDKDAERIMKAKNIELTRLLANIYEIKVVDINRICLK